MLRSDSKTDPQMTPQQRREFELALQQEHAAKTENVEAAKAVMPRLLSGVGQATATVRQLRAAREELGLSLAEMEKRTGIHKSALSRLENSKAPNPTLATLARYAAAIGKSIDISVADLAQPNPDGSQS